MLPQEVHIEDRNLEILPEWREKIEEELARLQRHTYDPILHARVELIGTSHHRHGAFEIHLVAAVPGETLTVSRQGEYVLPLIVEAFEVLDRRLREYLRRRHRQVKIHEEHVHHGWIVKLFPQEDYGFLATPEGTEVYFHANALKKGEFLHLKPGLKVAFGLEMGEKGLQATWVQVVD
uniref:HPF/RaiA family ribosome-associated protein n=1 Tax=Desulfobacca acetoxidans TaxID=60893 RepID=A0A7C5AMA9_9BACT